MASDYKVLVLPPDASTRVQLGKSGVRVREHRGWLEVPGAEWKSDAQEFSKRFLTSCVWWSMQTPVDQVWLCCFHQGLEVRVLRFAAETEGWAVNRGDGMPFEDTQALALWLRKWRSKKSPLAPRDGLELLNAFIGKAPRKSKPRARPKKTARPSTVRRRRTVRRKAAR